MIKVNNRSCISHLCRKSMGANRGRNAVLIIAIILTTVMMTTLFTVGGSIMKSIERNTMYQVGTSSHAGFKFLTEEEYSKLEKDPKVRDLSYNIIVGVILNDELNEDYTELRYTTKGAAEVGFSMPETGRLPEGGNEIAVCTAVLDDFGLPHETGQTLHLKISNGIDEYDEDFTVCGFWEKPAATMANQVFVSKEFQESFSPVWKNQADKAKYLEWNSYAGSINPDFNFPNAFNLSGQMEELKSRLGFGADVNEGVNWAYAGSRIDPTAATLTLFLLLLIMISGYLIINNIFFIAVSSDIRYYGLLKTVGTTNRQLRRLVVRQAALLSAAGIPVGLIIGYMASVVLFPVITGSFTSIPCEIYPDIRIFAAAALFSWLTVWIGCIRPYRMIKRISPVEAVRYSEYTGEKLAGKRKTKKVTPLVLAWENLKRSKRKTIVVILSISLSIIMINVTVSITESFDKNLYIRNFAAADFTVSDGSMLRKDLIDMDYEGVSVEDIEHLSGLDGLTDIGAVYMSESWQQVEGKALERMTKVYEEHQDWYVISEEQKKDFDQWIYDTHRIASHIYGVDEMPFENMEMDEGKADWERFRSGQYVIVSAPVEGVGDDGKYAYYQVGDPGQVQFPNGAVKEYEVLAIGDLTYSMGREHSHGLDVCFTLPREEYLRQVPESAGAMKLCFNGEEEKMDSMEKSVQEYCDVTKPNLGYTSRKTYLEDFSNMTRLFLLVGSALSFILALIGVLNFINLTVTSINERRMELGILRAVGMTRKQMVQMLVGEGFLRMLLTFVFVLTIGLALCYMIVHLIAGQMFMFRYQFVVWPVLVCIPLFTAISMAVPGIVIYGRQTRYEPLD